MRPGDVLVDDFLKYKHLWEEAGGVFIHHISAAESVRRMAELGFDVNLDAVELRSPDEELRATGD